MMGLGDGNFFTNLVNNLSGGEYQQARDQVDRLETLLKWSIGASLLAGALSLVELFWPRRR